MMAVLPDRLVPWCWPLRLGAKLIVIEDGAEAGYRWGEIPGADHVGAENNQDAG